MMRARTRTAGTSLEDVSCDVAIVGYGPVGMIAAALMAQQGLDVVVVERYPERYTRFRAGHIDGEVMRTFQRLGIAEQIELVARPMPRWQLVTAEREVLATIRLGEDGSGWKADYLSYQPEAEALVDARARELGVRVVMGMTAQAVTQDEDEVRLLARPTDDSAAPAPAHAIRAAYVLETPGHVGHHTGARQDRPARGLHLREHARRALAPGAGAAVGRRRAHHAPLHGPGHALRDSRRAEPGLEAGGRAVRRGRRRFAGHLRVRTVPARDRPDRRVHGRRRDRAHDGPDDYIFGAANSLEELPALVDRLAARLLANGWLLTPDQKA